MPVVHTWVAVPCRTFGKSRASIVGGKRQGMRSAAKSKRATQAVTQPLVLEEDEEDEEDVAAALASSLGHTQAAALASPSKAGGGGLKIKDQTTQ